MSDRRPDLSIVLPAWNEARNLPLLLASYAQAWPADFDGELVLVDNGSTDDTPRVLADELPKHAFARSVRVDQNRGYGHGIIQGLRAARGEVLAFSHADMQCPAQDVFAAYALYGRQPDPELCIVKGTRQFRGVSPAMLTGGMSALASVALGCLLRWHLGCPGGWRRRRAAGGGRRRGRRGRWRRRRRRHDRGRGRHRRRRGHGGSTGRVRHRDV